MLVQLKVLHSQRKGLSLYKYKKSIYNSFQIVSNGLIRILDKWIKWRSADLVDFHQNLV